MQRRSGGGLRRAALLGGGVVLGGALVWFWAASPDAAVSAEPAGASTTSSLVAATPRNHCDFEAALPRGEGDGQFAMPSSLEGQSAERVRAWLLEGKEAAASGRMRDAETAFMAACRAAFAASANDLLLVAETQYQLARHYGLRARDETVPAAVQATAARRANALYADALQVFVAKHGAEHERARFAAQGLQALREKHPALAVAEPATPERKVAALALPAEPVQAKAPAAPATSAAPAMRTTATQAKARPEMPAQTKPGAQPEIPAQTRPKAQPEPKEKSERPVDVATAKVTRKPAARPAESVVAEREPVPAPRKPAPRARVEREPPPDVQEAFEPPVGQATGSPGVMSVVGVDPEG